MLAGIKCPKLADKKVCQGKKIAAVAAKKREARMEVDPFFLCQRKERQKKLADFHCAVRPEKKKEKSVVSSLLIHYERRLL